MSTSLSFDWTATRNEIIDTALRKVGALDEEEGATYAQQNTANRELNALVKSWQAIGLNLWKIDWLTATLTASDEVTGTDSNIYTCIRSHTASTNNKPITGPNWTTYWKLLGSTGGVWAVGSYNAIGNIDLTNEVLGITEAFWRDGTSDVPMEIITRKEYMEISNKTTKGQPSKLWFDTSVLTAPRVHLWPQPDVDVSSDLTEVLHYCGITRLEDFDAGANTPDFDAKWNLAIIYNLAVLLAPNYSLSIQRKRDLQRDAKNFFDTAKGSTTNDQTDLTIQVDMRGY